MTGRPVSVCLDLSPSHGGMYRGVVDIATILDSLIVSFRDGSGTQAPDAHGLKVTSIDCTGLSKLSRAFRMPRRLRAEAFRGFEGAGVIVAHSLFRSHAMLVHEYSRSHGIPYVVVPHGALDPELWRTQRCARRLWMLAGGRRYLNDAASIVCATEAEQSHAGRLLGQASRTAVIPFPVDVGSALPTADEKRQARQKFGIPLDSRVLLVLGRLDPVKRPRDIITGFGDAAADGCSLVFAGGDGREQSRFLAAFVPQRVRSRVFFLGHLGSAAKADVLAASDGYLSWSAHESFGYAAAESMAAGLPVILSPRHPLAAHAQTSQCGIVPKFDDRPCLRDAISEFASWTRETISSRGLEGRDWVKKHLDRSVVASRWGALIEDVMAAAT